MWKYVIFFFTSVMFIGYHTPELILNHVILFLLVHVYRILPCVNILLVYVYRILPCVNILLVYVYRLTCSRADTGVGECACTLADIQTSALLCILAKYNGESGII